MDQRRRCEIFPNSPMYQIILLTILLIAATSTLASSSPSCRNNSNAEEQCACETHEDISISCANKEKIHIRSATYGRLDNITCNDGKASNMQTWNFSCSSPNSTTVVSKRCSNQKNCSFVKSEYNGLFGDPCSKIGKYLLVNYTCVSDASYTSSIAITEPASLTSTSQSTTMPLYETTQLSTGGNAHPWCSKDGKQSHSNSNECKREEFEQLSKKVCANDDGNPSERTKDIVQLTELSQNNSKCFTMSDAKDLFDLVLNLTSNFLLSTLNETMMERSPSDQSIIATRMLLGMEGSLAVLAAVTNTTTTMNRKAPGIGDFQINVINARNISKADLQTPITFSVDAAQSGMSQENGNNKDAQLEHSQEAHNTPEVQVEISREDVVERASEDGLGRAVFILYDNIEQWLKIISKNDSLENNKAAETDSYFEPFIITKVVSISFISDKGSSTNLTNPIKFTLRHNSKPPNSFSASCVFWKFSESDSDKVGHWSNEGCEVNSSNDYNTTCECDHLTNFAVLMSAANKTVSAEHLFALHVITNIGCAISIVCLALSLFVFCYFRNLQSDRNTIHKNLVFCLLIAELIFVFGITQNDKETLCAVIAGFLHYFFLASFAWMCLEGVQLYIFLVEVFEAEKSRVKWYYLGGYGFPALIVLISVCVSISTPNSGYGTKEHCWLEKNTNFVWAFNGPVIAVFVVNLVMLGLAIYMMCKHASAASWKLKEKSKIFKIGSWLRGAAILVVILGTTWIFGIFLIFDKKTLVFEYIFTILNSLQGLFIFVFHCLTNDKVQKECQRAIQRASWIPESVRAKCRNWGESGTASTSTHSTSSGKTRLQWMLSKSSRRESTMSDSSMQKLDPTSSGKETWSQHVKAISESTCLTDSSGVGSNYSDHMESIEDLRGYRESVISSVNESRFNVQHQNE